jgi:hypothetical protein
VGSDDDPSGSGLIVNARFRGQEGAADNAQNHAHLGVLGVTGFLMKNPAANPLDYVEGGPLNARREEISAWLDATNPDLSAFARRGGKMIVAIGTNDSLASPGAQLDYYQSVLDKMGRPAVDEFARFYVLPQTGHGLSGSSYTRDGDGRTIPAAQIPSRFDRVTMLLDWVRAHRSAEVRHSHGQHGQPAALLISHVSAVQRRFTCRCCFIYVCGALGALMRCFDKELHHENDVLCQFRGCRPLYGCHRIPWDFRIRA